MSTSCRALRFSRRDHLFIAPHAGMVAMIQNRHISAMLIYNDKTKLGKLLQSNK